MAGVRGSILPLVGASSLLAACPGAAESVFAGAAAGSTSTSSAGSTADSTAVTAITGGMPSNQGSTNESTASSDEDTGASESSSGDLEPCGEVHEGDLHISPYSVLSYFANIGRVTGHVVVSFGNREQADLSFLKCLHTIDGVLQISKNNYLTTTTGLENLVSVGALDVERNPVLQTMVGFGEIEELAFFSFRFNPAIKKIELPSLKTVKVIRIGFCQDTMAAANNLALVDLSGFESLAYLERLILEGNESLKSADLLDALDANGAPPLLSAAVRLNPMLDEAETVQKLVLLGVMESEICANLGGVQECFCLVGE